MRRLVVRALELVYVMVIRIHLVGVIIALLQQVRAKGVVVPRQALRQGLRQALRQVPHLHQHHRALVQMVMLCVTAIVQQGIQFTVHLLAIVKITNPNNNKFLIADPISSVSISLLLLIFIFDELFGNDIPITSNKLAIVFAV